MDVMKTLKSYRSALMEIDVIQLQIDHLQTIGAPAGLRSIAPKMERVPSEYLTPAERGSGKPVYVPAPRGTNNPEGKRMQEVGELERRLKEARERAADVVRDFETLLEALDNPNERLLIRLRYSVGKSPAETAKIMHVSDATFYRLFADIVQELEQKFDSLQKMG